jgi:hypothetical protein
MPRSLGVRIEVSMASSQLSNRRYKLPVVRAEEKVECSGIHATIGALITPTPLAILAPSSRALLV